MDDARIVDLDQRPGDGLQDGQGLLGSQPAATHLDIPPQVNTLDILHDDVGGIVGLKEVAHMHHFRHTGQSRQGLGLPDEPLPGVPEELALLVFVSGKGKGVPAVPVYETAGIKLLDGHGNVQPVVPSYVGDAEAALAQHLTHHVLSLQQRAAGQLMGLVSGVFVVAAVLADRAGGFDVHTAVATLSRHGPHLTLSGNGIRIRFWRWTSVPSRR